MRRILLAGVLALSACGLARAEDGPVATEADKNKARVAELVRELQSEAPQARIAAADALGKLGAVAVSAVPALLEAAKGEHAWIDTAMLGAVEQIGPAATPALLDLLQNGKDMVRARAATALWICDCDREQVLPIARKFAEDKDPRVRFMIGRAIAKYEEAPKAGTGAPAPKPVGPKALDAFLLPPPDRDWPQFQGPRRDSICSETGLLKQWPENGPPLLWKHEGVGRGMATVSIAGGKIVTLGDRKAEGQYVICLDLKDRKELWATRVGAPYKDFGALSTPTIDGDAVYALGTEGDLVCLDANTGALRWQKSLTKDFGGKMMSMWKFCESPLIDGEKLICTPGAKDAALVALNKKTGDLLWKCALPDLGPKGKDGAGYSSVVAAEICGVRQYVQLLGRGTIGVAADTGKLLWGYNRIANEVANITHPIVRGDLVFTTNSYNAGTALLKISRDGAAFTAEEAWFVPARQFDNHHGGVVMLGDYVYGGCGLNRGEPACLNFWTGELAWKAKPPSGGSACVLYADGHLIFRYDRGLLALVEATPKGFSVKSQFTPALADGPAWAHPVVFDKRLYLRHNDLLLCYDLSEKR